jgi:hypothetical protein
MKTSLLIINIIFITILIVALLMPYTNKMESFGQDDDQQVDAVYKSALKVMGNQSNVQRPVRLVMHSATGAPMPTFLPAKESSLPIIEEPPPPPPPQPNEVHQPTFAPLELNLPCACDCAALERKLLSNCASIQQDLDKCNMSTLQLNAKCADDKSNIQMSGLQAQQDLEKQIMTMTQNNIELTTSVSKLKAENDSFKNDNRILIKDFNALSNDIVSLQEQVLKCAASKQ